MAGSPKKRARKALKEKMESERGTTPALGSAEFNLLVDAYALDSEIKKILFMTTNAIEFFYQNKGQILSPMEMLEAADKLSNIASRMSKMDMSSLSEKLGDISKTLIIAGFNPNDMIITDPDAEA